MYSLLTVIFCSFNLQLWSDQRENLWCKGKREGLYTWLQASARKDSPSEPLAGGNSRKHLDFVIITMCHCSSCWHPDSNRITVIEQTSECSLILFWRYDIGSNTDCYFYLLGHFFFIRPVSPVPNFSFSLPLLANMSHTPFCLHHYHVSLCFHLLWHWDKRIWLQFQMSKKVAECFVNAILSPWQLLIWWFIAPKHVYMVVCYGMCCWPGSEFMSALLTTSLSWWKKDLIPYWMHLMVCMCTDEMPNVRGSTKTIDKNSINALKENLSRSQPQEPQKSY